MMVQRGSVIGGVSGHGAGRVLSRYIECDMFPLCHRLTSHSSS